MGAEIDRLDIDIQAQAQKASTSLNGLINKLDRLSSSLSNTNSRGFGTMASGISQLATAMSSFNANAKTADFTRIATGLGKLGKIDTSSFSTMSGSMKTLASGLSDLGAVQFDATGIASLATGLSKLGGIKATSGTQNLVTLKNDLVQFVSGMNSVGSLTFDVSSISTLLSSVSTLGGKKATQATTNLPVISAQLQNFVRQLNSIGSLSFDPTNLTTLVNSISKLGYKSASAAVTNIPQLAAALSSLMTTLSQAPAVSSNVINLTNALASLASHGRAAGTASNSLSSALTSLTSKSSSASRSAWSLAGMIGKIYANFWLLFRVFKLLKESVSISSQLTEVQNVVDTTFGNMSSKVDEFCENSIEKFGMSELSVKQFSSRFQAMGTAMGINSGQVKKANQYLSEQTDGYIEASDSIADMSLNLTKLTADIASFYDVDQEDVAEDLQSIYTGQTRPLRTYGLDLTNATLKEWALKNGLDADISSMTQAEKTMLRYQYVLANTRAAQGDFAKTADTWANQVRILKQNFQQLGSVIGTDLINALKPLVKAMNNAMSSIIAFAKVISDALGQIFGWVYEEGSGGVSSDWEDASDSASDLADSAGDAADSTAKMKENLQGFDKLNVITTDSSSGSGSGSGSGSSGSSGSADGGSWTQTDSILSKITSDIKTLEQLGETIRDALVGMMEGIDWDSVYEKARNFGSGLASFLNGLFSNDKNGNNIFSETGKTIAGALNTAIAAALAFAQTFDFSQFGTNLASGINSFFENFDFKQLAEALNEWVDGFEDAIASFLKTVKWSTILQKTGEFLGNLELDTVTVIIGALALKRLSGKTLTALTSGTFATWICEKLGMTAGELVIEVALITLVAVAVSYAVSDDRLKKWYDGFKEWFLNLPFDSHTSNSLEDGEITVEMPVKAMISQFKIESRLKQKEINDAISEWVSNITTTMETKAELFIEMKNSTGETDVSGWWDKIQSWITKRGKIGIEMKNATGESTVSEWWDKIKAWMDKRGKIGIEMKNATGESTVVTWWNKIKSWMDNRGKIGIEMKNSTGESTVSSWASSIKKWWNKHKPSLKLTVPKISLKVTYKTSGLNKIQSALVKALSLQGWPSLSFYKYGGFPDMGQMFIAREAGPELVGNIGNKSAVANNDQIVQAVSIGVANAVSQVLGPYLESGQSVNVTLQGGADQIFRVVKDADAQYRIRTGRSAFSAT